jgi:hypothetical protein
VHDPFHSQESVAESRCQPSPESSIRVDGPEDHHTWLAPGQSAGGRWLMVESASPPARRLVRPWVVLLFTVPAVLAGAAVVAVLLVLPPRIERRVVEEARARGVELSVGGVSLWFGSVGLTQARFTLQGVRGLEGSAERVDVLLDGLRPTRASIENLRLDLTGPVPDLLLDATAWTRRHPPGDPIPISATGVSLTWRAAASDAPWIEAEGARLSHSAAGASFHAERARVSGVEVKQVGASWTETSAALTLALGSVDPKEATVAIQVDREATPPRATVVLAPTPFDHLAGPLGLPLNAPGVLTTARAELVLPAVPGAGSVTGHFDAELDGFTPPHPVELDGFDFGKKTTLSTDLALSADHRRMDLSEMLIQAGAFALKGGGVVTRHDDHAVADITLKGNLPCNVIARSAARARVGSVLGKVLGNAAHRILEGSVGVTVRVLADSRKPGEAHIDRRIGVGCGLRPMSLGEIATLGLDSMSELAVGLGVPKEMVDRARSTVDGIPGALPPLPSALPTMPRPTLPSLPSMLPSLPKFEIRRKDDADTPPRASAAPAPTAAPSASP